MSRPNSSLVGAVTAVLFLAALGAAVAGPWTMEERDLSLVTDIFEPRTFATDAPDTPGFEIVPGAPPGPAPDLSWMRYVAIALAIGVVVTAFLWLVRRYRMTRLSESSATRHVEGGANPTSETPEVPLLLQGVHQARRVLDEPADPDDAIIAAWMTLETTALDAGVRRRPSQTPTEFAVAVLQRTEADGAAVRRLLALYRRARFSRQASDPDDVAEAVRCLEILADVWDPAGTGSGS